METLVTLCRTLDFRTKYSHGVLYHITDRYSSERICENGKKRMASSLLPSEKRVIADARSFARQHEYKIAQNQEDFSEKGSWGLWTDAKGFFNKSNKESVLRHMEEYREFYEEIATCIEKAEKGDADSLQNLVSICEKLEKLERNAECEVRRNTSKAICRMLQEFIGSKYALESKLKRVECVVLHKKVERAEEAARKSADAVAEMKEQMAKLNVDSEQRCADLLEANAKLRNLMEESNARTDQRCNELLEENRKLKDAMVEEKEELRNMMEEKMEDMIRENNLTLQKFFDVMNTIVQQQRNVNTL